MGSTPIIGIPSATDNKRSRTQINKGFPGLSDFSSFFRTTADSDSLGGTLPQGAAIYNALKHNPNLFLMLCGHFNGEGQRVDVFEGNTVYTLLSDYQGWPNGGDGWLRVMEFAPADDEIRVQTYSPTLDQFETDADSQFTLSYEMYGVPFVESGP